mmetsp:Transcript_45525/g.87042  ORF Transcript_45525/g.87042 Transcript_45525/m.87042 type:complete len:178 (-) Transcript_45525:1465-1998(-)
MAQSNFVLPAFYSYPPYFTLQPVADTREKQVKLWMDLILQYCRYHKIFVINVKEGFPLFSNEEIHRRLNQEAQGVIINALVAGGRAEWMDKGHCRCLVLWRTIADWADLLHSWARDRAILDEAMTVEELRSGDETRGTEFYGMSEELLLRAIKFLEKQDKAKLFAGDSSEELGVKFL